jgi:hypothetical protein
MGRSAFALLPFKGSRSDFCLERPKPLAYTFRMLEKRPGLRDFTRRAQLLYLLQDLLHPPAGVKAKPEQIAPRHRSLDRRLGGQRASPPRLGSFFGRHTQA